MLSWQRWLRLGLGVFTLVFAIGLVVSLRHQSRRPAPPPVVAKVDPKAVVQSTKGRLVLSKGTEVDVLVDYDHALTYSDGSTVLTGVNAKAPKRGERDFTAKAREGTVTGSQDQMTLKGAVEVTTNDGLSLHSEAANYTQADGTVRIPGPATFADGRTSGSAVGMAFDQKRDVLWLWDQAVIHIAPDEQGQGEADIHAGAAGFARRDKYIRFEKGMKIVRGGQTITSDEAVAYLTDDGKQIRLFSLRGSSRVSGDAAASGGLKVMTARDMDLTYGPDGRTLQHATLTGTSAIELAGGTPDSVRRIAGEAIDVSLAPDGTTATGLDAREYVQVVLPAENDTPLRIIRAARLIATGEESKGLTTASFTGGTGLVEFRETPPAPASARLARAATMDLAMQGGFNSIESARFGGGVRFEESDMAAEARDAQYDLAKSILSLSGIHAKTGRPPWVEDEQATIEARTIDLALDGRKINAAGTVKSDLRPRKTPPAGQPAANAGTDATPARIQPPAKQGQASTKQGRAPTKQSQASAKQSQAPTTKGQQAKAPDQPATRLPAMLEQDQPVSATCDQLDYDGSASHAIYTGHAQLWQGDTTIKGDRIVLDDQKGDLSAAGHVVTNMKLEQVNDKTKAKEQVHSTASAQEMVYTDEVRRATYTGGAHLNGPQGDLAADKIELYLKENGNEVERLEAYTAVSLKTPEGRKATGARLTYLAAEERYTMTGQPVKIQEECRETTGKTLTFFRSADRIIVDGNEQKRTETKGLGACGSEPRPRD